MGAIWCVLDPATHVKRKLPSSSSSCGIVKLFALLTVNNKLHRDEDVAKDFLAAEL